MREEEGRAIRTDTGLEQLRGRLTEVARRRLPIDAVEDVVQDALRVIVEKAPALEAGALVDGVPALAWCLRVLRHRIGNFYQHERVRTRRLVPLEAAASQASAEATPLEALADLDGVRAVRQSLDDLATRDGACGRYLRRLAAGESPARVAASEGVPEAAFYRRVYRCREKLRTLLRQRGVLT